MSKGVKMVVSVLGIFILLVTATIMVYYFNIGMGQNEKAKEKTSQLTSSMSDIGFEPYNNTLISGAEVIMAAKQFKSKTQFSILIKTGDTPAGFYTENNSSTTPTLYAVPTTGNILTAAAGTGTPILISALSDQSKLANYVNPAANFDSKVYYGKDGEVRLIVFTQRP